MMALFEAVQGQDEWAQAQVQASVGSQMKS
jgi:hypothetical protein